MTWDGYSFAPHGQRVTSQADTAIDAVFREIRKERERQTATWGIQQHDDFRWLAIFQEELGEACQAILQERHDDACRELIQSAAVLVAWLEHIFTMIYSELEKEE